MTDINREDIVKNMRIKDGRWQIKAVMLLHTPFQVKRVWLPKWINTGQEATEEEIMSYMQLERSK